MKNVKPFRPDPKPLPEMSELERHAAEKVGHRVFANKNVLPPGIAWCEHCSRVTQTKDWPYVEGDEGERYCPTCAAIGTPYSRGDEPPRRREPLASGLVTVPDNGAPTEEERLAEDALPTETIPAEVTDVEPKAIAPKGVAHPHAPKPLDARPCRLCRAPVAFVTNEKTRGTLPLDARANVFAVVEDANGFRSARSAADLLAAGFVLSRLAPDGGFEVVKVAAFAVSHFATCPNANSFSGRAGK